MHVCFHSQLTLATFRHSGNRRRAACQTHPSTRKATPTERRQNQGSLQTYSHTMPCPIPKNNREENDMTWHNDPERKSKSHSTSTIQATPAVAISQNHRTTVTHPISIPSAVHGADFPIIRQPRRQVSSSKRRIRLVTGLTSLLLNDVGELLELSLGSEERTEL